MLCLHTRGTQIQDICKAPCQREVWWPKNEKAHVLRALPSYKKLCKPLRTNLFSRKRKQLVCQSTKEKYHDKTHKNFAWISSQGRNPGANQPKQDTLIIHKNFAQISEGKMGTLVWIKILWKNSQKFCTNLARKERISGADYPKQWSIHSFQRNNGHQMEWVPIFSVYPITSILSSTFQVEEMLLQNSQ